MTWKTETYQLQHPLDETRLGKGRVPITEITFEEPDGIALEEIEEAAEEIGDSRPVAVTIKTISILSDIDHKDARRLHADDIKGVEAILVGFLGEDTTSDEPS